VGKFFSSEIVKKTMEELSEMQQELIRQVLYIPYMTDFQKKDHLVLMKSFLEKQKILLFRMNLSDDIEAKEVQKEIMKNATMFGVTENASIEEFFESLEKTIDGLAKILEE